MPGFEKLSKEYIRNGGNIRAAFKTVFPAHMSSTDRVVYAMCKGYTSEARWQHVEATMQIAKAIREQTIKKAKAKAAILKAAEQIKSDHPDLYAAIKHELDTYLD